MNTFSVVFPILPSRGNYYPAFGFCDSTCRLFRLLGLELSMTNWDKISIFFCNLLLCVCVHLEICFEIQSQWHLCVHLEICFEIQSHWLVTLIHFIIYFLLCSLLLYECNTIYTSFGNDYLSCFEYFAMINNATLANLDTSSGTHI